VSTITKPAPKRAVDYKAEIDRLLQEMDAISLSNRERQAEIDKIHSEIAVLRAQSNAILDRLEASF
jgi:hypothetical protein